MSVTAVNHFTVLTDDLPATLAFYEEHLNLKPGARPPFTFPGAWLYADGGKGPDPILHIVAGIEQGAAGEGRARPHGLQRQGARRGGGEAEEAGTSPTNCAACRSTAPGSCSSSTRTTPRSRSTSTLASRRPPELQQLRGGHDREQRQADGVGDQPGLDQAQRGDEQQHALPHRRHGAAASRTGCRPGRSTPTVAVITDQSDERPVRAPVLDDQQQHRLVDEHERHDVGRRRGAHRREARWPRCRPWRGSPRRTPRAPPAA